MKNKYIDNKNGTTFLVIESDKYGRLNFLIDTEDVRRVKSFRWSAKPRGAEFYAHTAIGNNRKGFSSTFTLHRIIMSFGCEIYDHIDRNPMNNTKANLRNSNHSLNARNRNRPVTAGSKYRGVYKRKPTRREKEKFRVQIRCEGKIHNFGTYACEIDAAKRYNIEAKRIYGEYANLNEV